jgi:hypothetical protein
MENKKSEFSEAVADISRFAGVLTGAAVVAGKKAISYLNDLTITETHLKPPTDEIQTSDSVRTAK